MRKYGDRSRCRLRNYDRLRNYNRLRDYRGRSYYRLRRSWLNNFGNYQCRIRNSIRSGSSRRFRNRRRNNIREGIR